MTDEPDELAALLTRLDAAAAAELAAIEADDEHRAYLARLEFQRVRLELAQASETRPDPEAGR